MDVVCNKCSHTLKIPDNKVPKGKSFSIACPKCKNKISVAPSGASGNTPKKKSPASKPVAKTEKTKAPPAKPAASTGDEISENGGDKDPFEFLEEGAKTAIICEPDSGIKEQIKPIIEKMEYHILESASPRDTLKQMRFRDFDLIVLNELFGTRDPEMNHVLKYLSQLNMMNRRNMFVLLLSERFRTGDNMQAFNKSVNLIINVKDMDRFDKVLELSINENERFYRTFKEAFARIKGL